MKKFLSYVEARSLDRWMNDHRDDLTRYTLRELAARATGNLDFQVNHGHIRRMADTLGIKVGKGKAPKPVDRTDDVINAVHATGDAVKRLYEKLGEPVPAVFADALVRLNGRKKGELEL